MWDEGKIGSYLYEVKHFYEPSKFGIDGGKISKLFIRDSKRQIVCSYDRGWDAEPVNDEVKEAVRKIMNLYN